MDHRDRMIEKFTHDPDVRVFLMSLKAGGVALNLTAASHVMLMDPWWVTLAILVTAVIIILIIIIVINIKSLSSSWTPGGLPCLCLQRNANNTKTK